MPSSDPTKKSQGGFTNRDIENLRIRYENRESETNGKQKYLENRGKNIRKKNFYICIFFPAIIIYKFRVNIKIKIKLKLPFPNLDRR